MVKANFRKMVIPSKLNFLNASDSQSYQEWVWAPSHPWSLRHLAKDVRGYQIATSRKDIFLNKFIKMLGLRQQRDISRGIMA